MMEVILRCLFYASLAVFYAIGGGMLLKLGIEEFKRGAYWASGVSFMLALSFATLIVRNAWLL